MYKEMDRFTFKLKRESDRDLAEQFGTASYLLALTSGMPALPTDFLRNWLAPAIMMNQIKIFYDEHGLKPVGFVTWAFLAADVEEKLGRAATDGNKFALHISEWNEGPNLWVMDFYATIDRGAMLRHLKSELFSEHTNIHYVARRPDGSIAKIKAWRRSK